MDLRIRPLREDDVEAVVQLSLAAWVPVFCSFERMLGPAFPLLYPDWRESQREAIEKVCRERDHKIVYVAELGGAVAGFVAYELNAETRTGTVEYLAVDPEHQNRGIGTALNRFVLEKMREAGMQLAVVGTGGDPGHAPARRSYEKAGYTGSLRCGTTRRCSRRLILAALLALHHEYLAARGREGFLHGCGVALVRFVLAGRRDPWRRPVVRSRALAE